WLGGGATVLPIFSNLGEMEHPGSIAEREPWMALFSYQADGRSWYWERLKNVINVLKPTRLVALGRPTPGVKAVSGIPCEETGVLPADAVSRWLARCRFGYLSYAPDCLGKSGIFAAYLAHGLCTVLADDAANL